MVSFCCDDCQEVVTKPKVQRHLMQCRNSKVSCLDCQQTFDLHSVGYHTSCISEAEKYGPKWAAERTREKYCSLCQLELNNAVHAEQHYASKKHRAALRRSNGKKSASVQNDICATIKDCKSAQKADHQHDQDKLQSDVSDKNDNSEYHGSERLVNKSGKHGKGKSVIRGVKVSKGIPTNDISAIKRIMKEELQRTKRQRMRPEALALAIRTRLGKAAPDDLDARVLRKAHGSKRFHVGKRRIYLADATGGVG